MPLFEPNPDAWARLDLQLLQNGPVHRYWRRSSLAAHVARLGALGWAVVTIDARGWADRDALHDAWAEGLAFPSYYGHNLDALNDCLGDVAERAYGFPTDATGLALVIDGYDGLVIADPGLAHAVLDIVAVKSRYGLLFGNPILGLVRTDDPTLDLAPVGATTVHWNADEWLIARHTPGQPDDGP